MESYTLFDELESGREYYILHCDGYTCKKYKGTFDVYRYSRMSGDMYAFAWFHNNLLSYYYTPDDEFYDVEYIKENAQRAIHDMEQRSLNIILKRLVNEDFEWS
jgi:predicted nucleotidyltransferase component of viral defense system